MPKQEKVLIKISGSILLKKVGLGEKFRKDALCTRKSGLGIELIKPSTILALLALKLYFRHMRIEDSVAQMVQIIQENQGF